MADMTWKVGDTGPPWRIDLGDQRPEGSWSLEDAEAFICYWDCVTGESIGSATVAVISSASAVVEFDVSSLHAVTAADRDLFAEVTVDFGTSQETFPNDRHLFVHVHQDYTSAAPS